MSRHVIPNAPGSPEGRVTTVGWDPPLNTFFAMAFDAPADDDPDGDEVEVFWVGMMPGEIPTVRHLEKTLAQHGVVLPMLVAQRLAEDQGVEGDRSAGRPASQLIASMLQQAETRDGVG